MITIDGWITIGTKLSTAKFDQQIKELENKIDSEEKKQELLNNKTREYKDELTKANKEVFKIAGEYDNAKKKAEQLADALRKAESIKPQTPRVYEFRNKYEEQAKAVEELADKLNKARKQQSALRESVSKTKLKYENTSKSIDNLRGKLKLVELKKQQFQMKELAKSARSFSDKVTNTIGQIGKMALAVLGVRSAYSLLRRASSTLAQYNQQYARDLEYIQFVIAQSLAPILEKVVNLAHTLMAYINYLSVALFEFNLFSNASARAFQQMSKSAGSMAKSTKKIKNNLASFDEINVLSKNNDKGTIAPSFDLSNIEDVEIPEWLKTLADILKPVVDFFKEINKKYGPVATGIALVVSALAGFWILKGLKSLFTGFGKAFSGFEADFTGFFDSLGRAVEAIAILGGLSLVIESITGLIEAFSESGMTLGEVAGLLGIVLGELAVAFTVLLSVMKLLNPSWQSIAGAVVIFGGLAVVMLTVTNLIKEFSRSGMTLNDVIGIMATVLISIVATMGMVALLGPAMTAGLVPFLGVVAGISAILGVMALTLPTILEAVEKFITGTAPSLSDILTTIANGIGIIITAIGTTLPPIIEAIGSLFTDIFDGIAKIIITVSDTIIDLQNSTINFIERLGPAINGFVDGVIQAITKLINFLISGIEYMVNLVIKGVNKIIEAINSVGENIGFTIPEIKEFAIPRFVPKLARGGIVAKPTQAIIGEAGREAVMPLDNNTEWMDMLTEKLSEKVGPGNQEITVRFEGTMAQLVRELKPQFAIEDQRAGKRIITEGVY